MKFIEGSTVKEKDDTKGHRVHDVKFAKNYLKFMLKNK